jgi:hypothetical protein
VSGTRRHRKSNARHTTINSMNTELGSDRRTPRTDSLRTIGIQDTWAGRYKEAIELCETLECETSALSVELRRCVEALDAALSARPLAHYNGERTIRAASALLDRGAKGRLRELAASL